MSSFDLDAVLNANTGVVAGSIPQVVLKSLDSATEELHEAVFFVKPEIASESSVDLKAVLRLINEQFRKFQIEIGAIRVLGSRYLKKHNVIGEHYGVINAISRKGTEALSAEVDNELKKQFEAEISAGALILGGQQFLNRYGSFTAGALAVMWDALNHQSKKIAPGTYALAINVFSERVILLNGFHPYQLEHFNADGRSIIVFVVRSAQDWSDLRDAVIGDTDPTRAKPGSLRQIFGQQKQELGIPVINKGLNGVHLSAGPLEGMVEVVRFFSDHEKAHTISPLGLAFGRALTIAGVSEEEIFHLMTNPELVHNGKRISAFDLTEKMNASTAAATLRAVL